MATKETTPLLRKVPPALAVPPMLIQPGVEQLDSPTIIPDDDEVFPSATFTGIRHDKRRRKMPQCIAHRGYKAVYPENTMAAFRGAIEVGVHALETDVHITKDDVVVLSHDATLKRCFGRTDKIIDLTWKEIEDLQTIAEPHQHMPRLTDLLEYLAQPGSEDIWLLLDIKLDNDADAIMRLMAKALAAVAPSSNKPWTSRVILGIWAAKYLPLCVKYLPSYPVTHIAFSVPYARHFFSVPHVSFNMLLPMLMAPGGKSFLRDAREKHHRQVYTWTVNEVDKMEWCIRRQLDGVITDNPKLFLEVCERFDESKKEKLMPVSWKAAWDLFAKWMWITIAAWVFQSKFRPVASQSLIRKVEKL